MFLRAVKRGSSVPRHFRVVRPITVAAKEVSSNEVPDERALNWILYFSHLAEPSQITVIDGTLLETDELDALAKEEEGTNDPRAILSASKRTLTKSADSGDWQLGNKTFTLDQVKEFFDGKMKDKHMYVIPYYNDWNNTYGIRISDSAYITLISIGLQTVAGHKVWADMQNVRDLEVVVHAADASIVPDEKLVNINVTPKVKASVEERIAEAQKRYDDGRIRE